MTAVVNADTLVAMDNENMDKTQFVYAWLQGNERRVVGSVFLDHNAAEQAAAEAQSKLLNATGFAPDYVVLKRQLTVRYTDWEISSDEDLTQD